MRTTKVWRASRAVHLRLPDLPDRVARDGMEATDVLLKYARDKSGSDAWNPALHPRAGTPPNPGWFAPTDGSGNEPSPIRTVANENSQQSSDASPSTAGTSASCVRTSITMPRLVGSSFQRDWVMSSESRTTWLRSSGTLG